MAITIINYNNKKGLTIPLVLCIILIIVCYIISLSWVMSISRDRFENTINNQKAYYMARSAMEHIELKLRTMHHYCYESITNLENAPDNEKDFLFSVFIKDILKPLDKIITDEKLEYNVNEFKIFSFNKESSTLTFEIKVTGKYGGYESSVKRLISIGL